MKHREALFLRSVTFVVDELWPIYKCMQTHTHTHTLINRCCGLWWVNDEVIWERERARYWKLILLHTLTYWTWEVLETNLSLSHVLKKNNYRCAARTNLPPDTHIHPWSWNFFPHAHPHHRVLLHSPTQKISALIRNIKIKELNQWKHLSRALYANKHVHQITAN